MSIIKNENETRVVFGEGDIFVESVVSSRAVRSFGGLHIIQSKEKFTPGESTSNYNEVASLDVTVLSEDLKGLIHELKGVTKYRNSITIGREEDDKTLVFDFSRWNENSVDVVIEHLERALVGVTAIDSFVNEKEHDDDMMPSISEFKEFIDKFMEVHPE